MRVASPVIVVASALCHATAGAVEINWVDWRSSAMTAEGFTATGVITSGSESITVTYHNPRGVAFHQTGAAGDIDYWVQRPSLSRDELSSPYTSPGPDGVDNIPTGPDMIALRFKGEQTLTFSQPVRNLVFAFISLNGNGYGFDQDFELLSFGSGDLDGGGIDDCGFWGCGVSFKNVTANEHQLLGTGEPHGALRFTGVFEALNWRSLSDEFWNGFTVGVQGTKDQYFPSKAGAAP